MHRSRVFAASLALLMVTACDTSTIVTGRVLPTQITTTEVSQIPDGLPTFSGTEGMLIVEGAMQLPTPCYSLTGHTTIEDHNLAVVVEAQVLPGTCVAMLSNKRYSLAASELPTGIYTVTLTHRVIDSRGTQETVVAQGTAAVP